LFIYYIQRLHTIGGKAMPKIWKVATLVALAAIPLLLVSKKKDLQPQPAPVITDDNNIFEADLRAE
jgi:hypothetical protein